MLYIFYPQYIVLSHHYAFPSNLGVITLPLGMISPQACLASTTGRPSPWRPEEKLSLCKLSRRWPDFLFPWLWSQQCRQRFCLCQKPRRERRHESSQGLTSSHSGSFGVSPRWFGKTNKNQYAIITFHLPAMRKSIIHPLHQLLAPDPYVLFQLSTWLHHSTSGLVLIIIWFTKNE